MDEQLQTGETGSGSSGLWWEGPNTEHCGNLVNAAGMTCPITTTHDCTVSTLPRITEVYPAGTLAAFARAGMPVETVRYKVDAAVRGRLVQFLCQQFNVQFSTGVALADLVASGSDSHRTDAFIAALPGLIYRLNRKPRQHCWKGGCCPVQQTNILERQPCTILQRNHLVSSGKEIVQRITCGRNEGRPRKRLLSSRPRSSRRCKRLLSLPQMFCALSFVALPLMGGRLAPDHDLVIGKTLLEIVFKVAFSGCIHNLIIVSPMHILG